MKPGTPLPWEANSRRTHGSFCVVTALEEVAYASKLEDAAYLAHASNAYPKLVDRLKCTLLWLETLSTRNRSEDVHYQRIHDLLRELGEAQ